MITTKIPTTWRDLQREVGRILEECGCDVVIEKTVRAARGTVEIDVYAEESVKGRRYRILCECKYWKKRVPKTVIHAFRTVVADVGANVGYVISTQGFQKGAFTASELTNLHLVTWQQFQDGFEESWLEHCFIDGITKALDPLLSYTEPLLPAWFDQLPDAEQDAFIALKDKYDPLGIVTMSMTRYARFGNRPLPTLPLSAHLKPDLAARLPTDVVEALGYRQLYDALLEHGGRAIAEFRAIRDRNGFAPPPKGPAATGRNKIR